MSVPEKRPAYEPPRGLVRPLEHDPQMKRPLATVTGGVLVLLRVVAGVLWLISVSLGWEGWIESLFSEFSGGGREQVSPADLGVSLGVFIGVVSVIYLVETVFGVLIIQGRNFPRMVVMILSVLAISVAFASWWAQGQEIRFETTLLTLAFDILVLLALSSRSAAAYARRNERR